MCVLFEGQIHNKTDFKRGVSQAEGAGLKYFKPAVNCFLATSSSFHCLRPKMFLK